MPDPTPPAPTSPPTASGSSTPTAPPLKITLPGQSSPAERWLWRGLLLILCLLAYTPSLSDQFIWDDNRHAAAFALRDGAGLEAIWTKVGLVNGGTPQYYPLTHTTYWLEYQLWGRSALGYRVTNILFHVGTALVLWELLRRLRVPGAFLGAALFALHPVMVESVAWTSERKNTLSLLLALTSLLFYARFAGLTDTDEPEADTSRSPDWNLFAIASIAFVGAMLAKTMAASTPVLVLLMLWWKGKLTPCHLALLTPWVAIALSLGLFTAYVEHRHVIRPPVGQTETTFTSYLSSKLSGEVVNTAEFQTPFPQRVLMAGVVPWFYASKLALPATLAFFYPRWDLGNAPAFWWLAHAGLLALLAASAYLAFARGTRWPLALLIGYLVALFPAMGFIDVYPFRYSFVADHFSYHASWMLLAAAGAGLAVLAAKLNLTRDPRLPLAFSAAILLLVAGRTYVHAHHFIDDIALWSHTLKVNPGSWAAANNLSHERIENALTAERTRLQARGMGDNDTVRLATEERDAFLVEARRLANLAISLKPDHALARHNLGMVAFIEGKPDEALAAFRESARLRESDPDARDGAFPPTYLRMAEIQTHKGDLDAAADLYRRAISLERPPLIPRDNAARLALLRLELRRLKRDFPPSAVSQATTRTATATSPTGARATTAPATGRTDTSGPATAPVERAQLLLDLANEVTSASPNSYDAWLTAGDLAFQLGRHTDALVAYRRALQLRETDDVLVSLGLTLANLGQLQDAAIAFARALELNPQRPDARRFLEALRPMLARLRPPATTSPSTAPATQPATTRPTP